MDEAAYLFRSDGPDTSAQAAASLDMGRVSDCIRAIVGVVQEHPGLTPGQISDRLHLYGYEEVKRRTSDAVRKGLLHKQGKARWHRTNKEQMRVWPGGSPMQAVQCACCGHVRYVVQ